MLPHRPGDVAADHRELRLGAAEGSTAATTAGTTSRIRDNDVPAAEIARDVSKQRACCGIAHERATMPALRDPRRHGSIGESKTNRRCGDGKRRLVAACSCCGG